MPEGQSVIMAIGASNVVNGTTKPAPPSLKQFFQGKESHGSVKLWIDVTVVCKHL